MRILLVALTLAVATASQADEYKSPFQTEHENRESFRPTGSFTLGMSSLKTGSNSIIIGPSGGGTYFVEDSTGDWIFLADAHLSLLSGLTEGGIGVFASGGVGGGHYVAALKREAIAAVEYRHSFDKSVKGVGVVRIGVTPEPEAPPGLGYELQYTIYSRATATKRFSYPTTMFVVRYYF